MRNLTAGDENPLEKLRLSCIKLLETNSSENTENFEYYVKLYCSISQSAIRDIAEFEPKQDVLIRYYFGISYNLIDELVEDSLVTPLLKITNTGSFSFSYSMEVESGASNKN